MKKVLDNPIESVKDAVANPLKVLDVKIDAEGRRSQRFIGKDSTVNINPDNGIITTAWKTGERTARKYRKGDWY